MSTTNQNETQQCSVTNLIQITLMPCEQRIAVLSLCLVVIQAIAAKSKNQMQLSLAQLDPTGGHFCTETVHTDHNFCSDQPVWVILLDRQLD